MNTINLVGRLTRDPEVRVFGEGSADPKTRVRFTVAVPQGYGSEAGTDFIPVTAWNGLGKAVATWCKKGHRVAVTGRLRVWSYRPEGAEQNRTLFEIVAAEVNFLTPLPPRNPVASPDASDTTGYDDFGLPPF